MRRTKDTGSDTTSYKRPSKKKKRSSKKAAMKSSGGDGAGHKTGRIGSKRSDLRFRAQDGSVWDSPFEYKVFSALNEQGYIVRRATKEDAIKYTTPVKNGRCDCDCHMECDCEVVQDRVYTPDLVLYTAHPVYLETKGHFAGTKRNLFRNARSQSGRDVRVIASSNHWVTKGKTRLTDWAKRFKIPLHVWDGKLPEDW